MLRRALLALALMLGCLSAVAVTSTADAAGCVALQDADVRYGAPNLVGQTAVDFASADCYLLPGGVGATYGWVEPRPSVRLAFRDANGGVACPQYQEICQLQGPAPYTARVISEAQFPYEVNLVRLDGTGACPPGDVPPFSASSPSMRLTDTEPWLACRAVDLRAGRHLMLAYTDTSNWTLLANDGDTVCQFKADTSHDAMCTVPSAGSYRIVARHLVDTTPGYAGPRFSIAYLGASSGSGCQPPIDTSWSSPAVNQRVDAYLQIDCHELPGGPGDRIGKAGGFEVDPYPQNFVDTEVVDAAGRLVCNDLAEPGYGCLLEGSAPYRLISWAQIAPPLEQADTYIIAARSLAPALGCPLVTEATPFNTPVNQLNRGTGCWQYEVAPGEVIRTKVGKVTSSGIDAGEQNFSGVGGLLGPDFVGRCNYGFCQSTSPGRHTIVTNLKGGDHVLGIYRWSDPRGCRPLATDFTTLQGSLVGGQMMCVVLDVPEGRGAGLVLPTRAGGFLLAEWYNAAGVNICEGGFVRVSVCTTQGPGPYHVVIGGAGAHDYFVSAFDFQPPISDPQECIDTPVGQPVELNLTAGTQTVCFLAGLSDKAEDISVTRTAGSGRFQAIKIRGAGRCEDVLEFSASAQLGCVGSFGSTSRRAIVIVGDGGAATVEVTRSRVAPLPSVMTNLVRPTLHGKPWVGRSLAARPGRWSPAGATFFYVWSVNGKRLAGPTSMRKLKLRPRYVGKKVAVFVVAVKPGSEPAVAVSKPVKVRRKSAR